MTVLIIFNRNPYDGTDVTWNALRLCEKILDEGMTLKIFLMNDSIDLAKEGIIPAPGNIDLTDMLKSLIKRDVPVKVCGSCLVRCGIHKEKPLIQGAIEAKMPELAEWVKECEKCISF